MTDRPLIRFHVEEAKLGGFVVQVDGEIYAAFSDARALANWVERHCADPDAPAHEVEDVPQSFPRVVEKKRFFGGNST